METPFLTTDLEAHPAPLPVMASGRGHGKHLWGGGSCHDGHKLLSHRVWMGASPSRASPSTRWGFTLRQRLPLLASYHGADLCMLIGVGLLLLQTCLLRWRWPLSCTIGSLPRRGSWRTGKAPSLRRRMDWRLLSTPLGRCAQNVTPIASKPRLSSRTSLPRCTHLVTGQNSSSTSIGRWRNTRSSFACKRRSWRCKRQH
jgi:hypothetical protein